MEDDLVVLQPPSSITPSSTHSTFHSPRPPDIHTITGMRIQPWLAQLHMQPSFADNFPTVTAHIIQGIETGVDIHYIGNRKINRRARNAQSTKDKRTQQLITQQILKDVADGKKAGPFLVPPFPFFSVSPIGAIPKGEGVRVIHNLSHPWGGNSINNNILQEKLLMCRFDDACNFIRRRGKGCFLVKFDVEAAFKQIPVRVEDRPLLGLKWDGKYYYELTLPFGLRTSGNRWEMYASALHWFFRHHLGIELIIHYVDDFLFVAAEYEAAVLQRDAVIALCIHLNIPMASHKTAGPVTCLTFLGIELDTIALTARLPAKRLADMQQLLYTWDDTRKLASVPELQSLIGKLQFACKVVRPGRTYLRRLIDMQTNMERAQKMGIWGPRRLSYGALADIRWWRTFIAQWNGLSLIYDVEWTRWDDPSLLLYTDACELGYGARHGNRWFQGQWTPAQLASAMRKQKMSMPFLELHALVHAATVWGHLWGGKKITFMCDCQPAYYAIYRMSSKDSSMAALLRLLSTTAATHSFDFRCIHLAGVTNTIADVLSRGCSLKELRVLLPSANATAEVVQQLPLAHQLL